jgi:hypothetical protein
LVDEAAFCRRYNLIYSCLVKKKLMCDLEMSPIKIEFIPHVILKQTPQTKCLVMIKRILLLIWDPCKLQVCGKQLRAAFHKLLLLSFTKILNLPKVKPAWVGPEG